MADPVWLMVMFDLPVQTKDQRRSANQYRNLLYDRGFAQIQFSIYAKYLVNATGVRSLLPGLRAAIPPLGEVRILRLTDEQWASMYRFYGAAEVPPEVIPPQLALFPEPEKLVGHGVPKAGRSRSGVKTVAPDQPELLIWPAIQPTPKQT